MDEYIQLNPGNGGERLATDKVGERHHQIVKLGSGKENDASLIDSYNPLPISLGDSASVDAFQRLRVSNPYTLFDSKQLINDQTLFWNDEETSGGGTSSVYSANLSATTLGVSNLTAGTRVRQTRRRFNYQSGKSQLIIFTALFGTGATGITRRVGYFDDNNGLFFEQNASTFRVAVRTKTSGSAATTYVDQNNWNGDPLDGSGASGKTIDPTKVHIFFIDFEWLGAGRVRFGCVVDGHLIVLHSTEHFNALTNVYMTTPNLPVRYEIVNSGTGPAASLLQICSTVLSEGNSGPPNLQLSVDRGSTGLTTGANTSIYPLLALKMTSAGISTMLTPVKLSVVCNSSTLFRWALLLNPTVSGTALVYSDVDSASVQACVGSTNGTTLTDGTILLSGYSQQTAESVVSIDIPEAASTMIGSAIDGTPDTLVLAVQPLSGSAETFYASLTWQERQ